MWPALIMAGGSILGSALSGIFGVSSTNSANSTNLQATRETNEANRKLAEQQNKFNLGMWHLNNEYNSPLNQMRRLQQAGLSGAAAAQSVSGVAAQPVQSANLSNQVTPPPVQAPDYSFIGQNFIGIARELAALKKETAEANIAETTAQFQPQMLLTNIQKEQAAWKLTMQELHEKMSTFGLRQNGMWLDNQGKALYNKNLDLMNKKLDMDTKFVEEQIKHFKQISPLQIKQLAEEINGILLDNKNKEKQGELLDAQTDQVKAQTAKTNAETEGQKYQNQITFIQSKLHEYGYPEHFAERMAVLCKTNQLSKHDIEGFLFSVADVQREGWKSQFIGENMTEYYRFCFDPASYNVNKVSSNNPLALKNFGEGLGARVGIATGSE